MSLLMHLSARTTALKSSFWKKYGLLNTTCRQLSFAADCQSFPDAAECQSFPDESSVKFFPANVMETMKGADWDNRIALQAKWTNEEKGWQVPVEWKETSFGVGIFAAADIPEGTILRVGTNGKNLLQAKSVEEIKSFCQKVDDEYQGRVNFASDYLIGFSPNNTDYEGYDLLKSTQTGDRFFGMWIPGNGLNHDPNPNTVHRTRQGGTDVGMVVMSLRDIAAGEEMFDDYRRYGLAPKWLSSWAKAQGITLNFADCNDFVDSDLPQVQSSY